MGWADDGERPGIGAPGREGRIHPLAVAQLPLFFSLLLRARAVDAGGRVPDELRRPGEARLDLAP